MLGWAEDVVLCWDRGEWLFASLGLGESKSWVVGSSFSTNSGVCWLPCRAWFGC